MNNFSVCGRKHPNITDNEMAVALENDLVIYQQEQKNVCKQNCEMLSKEETVKVNLTSDETKSDEEPTKLSQKHYEMQEGSEEEETIKSRKRQVKITPNEKMPKLSIRFDGIQHVPDFDDSNERRGFRCKRNKCGKQTTVFCEKCKVHLCFVPGKSNRGRNCFKKFHQLNEN